MRLEAILWGLAALYYVVIGFLYLVLSDGEPAGTALLLAGAGFGGLVAGWLWHWHRGNAVRAEDVATADANDEVGIVGVYPSASLRPLGIAVGMIGTVTGIAVGLWMTLSGLAILASQVVLLVRDADR
ncbi:MAG: cytochrome c oxidase subunit 4 [Acidimicrobiales bacterium]